MTNPDIDHLLLLIIRSAFMAGKAIMQVYGEDHLVVKIKKDFTPLTIADQAAHDVLMTCLEKTKIPVISEEGIQHDYSLRGDWELFWLVDPLDGTKEFLKGNADIYHRFGPTMEWDTAAGQAIAVHSDCSVTRYDTDDILTYNKKDLRNPWFIVKRNSHQ